MNAKRLSLALAAMLAPCCLVQAQSPAATPPNTQKSTEAPEPPKPPSNKPASTQAPAPLTLKGAGPASTESAAASAARDLAWRKDKANTRAEGRDKNRAPEGSSVADDAVVEFHAVSPEVPAGTGSAPATSNGGHQARSRIHGDLYGAAGQGGHATAESVGVTSKDRKTSVYVGGDQIRSEPSQSH